MSTDAKAVPTVPAGGQPPAQLQPKKLPTQSNPAAPRITPTQAPPGGSPASVKVAPPAKKETPVDNKEKEEIQEKVESQLSGAKHPADLDDILFNLLADKDGRVPLGKFWSVIMATGLQKSDVRFSETRENFAGLVRTSGDSGDSFSVDEKTFKKLCRPLVRDDDDLHDGPIRVDKDIFKQCCHDNIVIIGQAFKNDLVVPEFGVFCQNIQKIYESCKDNTKGKPADYIPQLARVNPAYWGVSICTIDGQRHNIGDTKVPFCLQSTSKALNYALSVSDLGPTTVHQFIGQEPSGRSFNELTLDSSNKPHNPMINAGAIVTTSLLKPTLQIADRFDYVHNQYKRMAGGEYVGFSNATYLSERETADRNFALGYYMRENKCYPKGCDLTKTLEFYFQLCSVEVTAESASVIAATLANGGICPTTGERVLAGDAVRNTLSLMHSCGMYDYSGQFAFKVGLPAKSGVAGAILLVVPNVMGICTWSPPLDEMGNSCRGVQFCEELVGNFNFHNYDNLKHTAQKMDPRKRQVDNQANAVVNLLFGAANGDVTAIRRFAMLGMDLGASDYDGRTALHLACAEGHLNVVEVLLEQVGVPLKPKDRWDFTPLDDAKKFQRSNVVKYLAEYETKLNAGTLPRIRRGSTIFS